MLLISITICVCQTQTQNEIHENRIDHNLKKFEFEYMKNQLFKKKLQSRYSRQAKKYFNVYSQQQHHDFIRKKCKVIFGSIFNLFLSIFFFFFLKKIHFFSLFGIFFCLWLFLSRTMSFTFNENIILEQKK